jgi:1-hydroxycarotenoid 3,4-desaturase
VLRDQRVVVVGAGVGGLVSALLLACRGLDVTLVEAAPGPGGKMRQISLGDVRIDGGPTVFTMRWVFDQILADAGSSVDELLRLKPLRVLARHVWRNSDQRLDLLADVQHSADEIGRFAGADEARRYLAFCAEARAVHEHLETPALGGPRPTLAGLMRDLGPGGLKALARLGPFATLWARLGKHFRDPRLRQLFGRYATYCGGSPWQAPATLMLVAHVEQSGVWALEGGMHALAQALSGLAAQRGARQHYGRRCERILVDQGRVTGVRLEDGEVLRADAVVFNGDTNALARGLLGPEVEPAVASTPRHQRSLSALTWAVHGRTSGFPLARHNVFFDDDYASEFDDIFRARRLPQRGTVYVCAQDRDDRAAAPAGRERLLCLVNAPADGDRRPFDAQETDPCLNRSLALMQHCGLRIEDSPRMVATTPADFDRLFPATGGALYGPATHGWMTLFRRPGSMSALPGLFLAGGSVHPGPGVPMAALSGQLAAGAVMAHLDSTSRSHRVGTSGGTSTPSVTTAGTA